MCGPFGADHIKIVKGQINGHIACACINPSIIPDSPGGLEWQAVMLMLVRRPRIGLCKKIIGASDWEQGPEVSRVQQHAWIMDCGHVPSPGLQNQATKPVQAKQCLTSPPRAPFSLLVVSVVVCSGCFLVLVNVSCSGCYGSGCPLTLHLFFSSMAARVFPIHPLAFASCDMFSLPL